MSIGKLNKKPKKPKKKNMNFSLDFRVFVCVDLMVFYLFFYNASSFVFNVNANSQNLTLFRANWKSKQKNKKIKIPDIQTKKFLFRLSTQNLKNLGNPNKKPGNPNE
jgi:heme/copper-type cytochrome/quinol oxidase subunit 3